LGGTNFRRIDSLGLEGGGLVLTAAMVACVGLAMVDVVELVDVFDVANEVDMSNGRPWTDGLETGGGGAVLEATVPEVVVALTVFS
jgi:hypothetical protein